MLNMDGLQLLAALKSSGQSAEVPVVMISTESTQSLIDRMAFSGELGDLGDTDRDVSGRTIHPGQPLGISLP